MRATLLLVVPLLAGCIDYDVDRRRLTDDWSQPAREGGVDILWVVDDSQSMYEEQALLAAHAGAFISFLSTVAVDYQLGVVTTDPSAGLAGDLLSADKEGLIEAFADQVTNGANGERVEQGFAAALSAFPASGGAFSRPEADIELVFFSDEDDQSGVAAADFLDALQAARPEGAVAVNAIVGDLPDGCAGLSAAADAGPAYVEAQEATGGARESICTADYDAMLERVALQVLGLDNTFALSAVPDLDTVEVRVDGALLHPRARHGWRYDAGANAIILDGYAVPPPGAAVEIRYYEWLGEGDPGAG